jgi:magnesium-transporting ATPase (P-type)
MKKDIQLICKARRDEKNQEGAHKLDEAAKMHRAHEIPSPLLLSGTSVAGGEGRMVCIMVGESSCLGQIILKLIVRPEVTPLQHKLESIATDIGKMGTYIAVLIIHVLLFRYFLEGLG